MSQSDHNSDFAPYHSRWNWVGIILLLAFCALRFVHLDADPPIDLTTSQGVYTDPAAYTLSARNEVLYGDSNPIGDHRFPQFEYNAISGVALIVYKLFGVSYYTSNLTALIFSLLTVVLLFLLLRSVSIFVAVSFLLFLMFDENQFQYGRLPFLENALVLFGILSFWLTHRAHNRKWMAALAGLTMPVAFLFGKAHGLVFAPIFASFFLWKLFFTDVRDSKARYLRGTVYPFIVGSFVTVIIWYVTIGAQSLEIMRAYLSEQSTGLYGAPEAFTGPLHFIWKFMNLGVQSYLNKRIPFVGAAACITIGAIIYRAFSRKPDQISRGFTTSDVVVFLLLWTVFTYGELFPWNYRPLRYQLPLFYGIAALASVLIGSVLERIFDRKSNSVSLASIGELSIVGHVVVFTIEWILYFLVLYSVFSIRVAHEDGVFTFEDYQLTITFLSLTLAFLTHIGIQYFRARRIQIAKWALAPAIVLGFLLTFVVQYKWFHHWLVEPTYTTVSVSRDLGKMLGENAVLSGPYGVGLAQDNTLHAIVHQFGVADPDTSFFEDFPVTHILVDETNKNKFDAMHPEVAEKAEILLTYHITNRKVYLIRVTGASPYTGSYRYRLSLFETGVLVSQGLVQDPDNQIGNAFMSMDSQNIAQNLYMAKLAEERGHVPESRHFYLSAAEANPTDFNLWAELGRVEYQLYKESGDPMYIESARKHFERARDINPSAERVNEFLDSLGTR